MEAIKIIVSVVAIVSSFALWAGLIMLCVKKWRQKGKWIFLYSILGVIIAPAIGIWIDSAEQKQAQVDKRARLEELARKAGYANYAEQLAALELEKQEAEKRKRETQDKLAREAGFKDYEDQQSAERIAEGQAEQEARLQALAGFPDEQTQQAAKTLGITRYEAYRLIGNERAITRYCAYKTQAVIFEQDKHSRMDRQATEAAKGKVWGEYEALQKKLIDNLNNDLDLVDFEYVQVSQAGHWETHCRASENNWSVITEMQAEAATRSDAKEAQQALNAFYLYNLNNQTTPFFNQSQYSAVDCAWDNLNGMRFAACKLHSLSYKSSWQMFLVGRIDGGRLAVYPINGDTSGKLNNTQARFHDESFEKRIFIRAYEEPYAYLARYAGRPIDIKAVRALFD